MGKSAKYPTGVRVRNGALQINFQWNKKRYNVTLPFEANTQGIRTAVSIRNDLISKAKLGLLTDKDIDEASGREQTDLNVTNFSDYKDIYLDNIKSNRGHRTVKEYEKSLAFYWMPYFSDIPIQQITKTHIRKVVNKIPWKTEKTRSNALIPLRGVFNLAVEDEVIQSSPVDIIKNNKHQKPPPDPFTVEEMEILLADLKRQHKGKERIYYWYFELAFWTGLRTSELIALTWQDIDWNNRTMRIDKKKTRGVVENKTKTAKVRDVKMNSRSEQALKALQELTYLQQSYVFMMPDIAGQGWDYDKPQRDRLIRSMRRCGIRHRKAYNTRHTYATMCLTAGMNIFFVASQLGHSVTTLQKDYAKWIDVDKMNIEMSKLDIKFKSASNS